MVFVFVWWDVADLRVESASVVPVDPFDDRKLGDIPVCAVVAVSRLTVAIARVEAFLEVQRSARGPSLECGDDTTELRAFPRVR